MKKYYCCVSGKVIPKARVKALKLLGIPEHQWTCIEYANSTKIKGIYMGEPGTSELKLVNKVYNDSVRQVFERTEEETDEPESLEDET